MATNRRENPMDNPRQLLGDARLLGVARCSEAEPQCTAVGRTPAGDLVLADGDGNRFTVPAAEVAEVLRLAQGSTP
jgi:hypothetical protein